MIDWRKNIMPNSDIDLDIISYDPPFTPNKLRPDYLPRFKSDLPESVKTYVRELINLGWKIYAVDQSRGRCYYSSKVITIPTWAIRRGTIYFTWYVSHECAHAYNHINKTCDIHGPNFMEWLKRICPENAIHHELGYKPRNAAAAGIGKTPFLEL
jgi:hypothetical protein